MAQFARPTADISIGSWTNQSGGTSNLYQSIDEVTPSDTDYVQSEQLLSDEFGFLSTILVEKLGTITDPETNSGLVLRVRASKDIAVGNEQDIVVELRQGYMNETDPGILIAILEVFSLSETPTTFTLNLTEAEAALITDFSLLYLRILGRVGTV